MHIHLRSKAWRGLALLLALVVAFSIRPVPAASAARPLALATGDHLVYELGLSPLSPNILPLNQNLNFSFKYRTTEPGGVRIFFRPLTAGELTPSYGAHGSGVYPVGSGAGTAFFTITAGEAVVDQVRIQMWNADQSVLLFQALLPVHYRFSSQAHLVSEVVLTQRTPNILALNQNLDISFKYRTTEPGGVRIFFRPVSAGALSPNYGAHGSGVYPVGSGAGTAFFTITAGEAVVDHIRIQMWNADQSVLLLETLLPVYYWYNGLAHSVSEIGLTPPSPNILDHGQDVNLSSKYITTEAGGVRIFARPFSFEKLAPNYGAHGSGLYPAGSGAAAGSFTISSGPVVVDHIRFQMLNADQSVLLFETLLPVYYQYGSIVRISLPVIMKP